MVRTFSLHALTAALLLAAVSTAPLSQAADLSSAVAPRSLHPHHAHFGHNHHRRYVDAASSSSSSLQARAPLRRSKKSKSSKNGKCKHGKSQYKGPTTKAIAGVGDASSSGSSSSKGNNAAAASSSSSSTNCFPSAGFKMPGSVPNSTAGWWCPRTSEYAFLGFSYALFACPSKAKLTSDFKKMRNDHGARYVRLYGNCPSADKRQFNDVVDAAWDAGIGVIGLVWFGFNGGNAWKTRKANVVDVIHKNPRAPFVVRSVAVGSEPLFDYVLPPSQLNAQVSAVRKDLSKFDIAVSISEMPYGFQQRKAEGSYKILPNLDVLQGNFLPFFDGGASTGADAWSFVSKQLNWYTDQTSNKKKMIITQTGWPSDQSTWKANSARAVSSVAQEKAYFELLDSKCESFKKGPQGGVGWFAHVWSDDMVGGWGIMKSNGQPKFKFNWRTKC